MFVFPIYSHICKIENGTHSNGTYHLYIWEVLHTPSPHDLYTVHVFSDMYLLKIIIYYV